MLIISYSSAARMDFLQCNLSPIFLFSRTNDIKTNLISVAMNVTLINTFSTAQHPKEPFCNGIQRALILLVSCLLGSFVRNWEAPDYKLKINELRPYTVLLCQASDLPLLRFVCTLWTCKSIQGHHVFLICFCTMFPVTV